MKSMNTPRTASNIPMHQRNARLVWTAKTPVKKNWTRVGATFAALLISFGLGVLAGLLAMTAIILSN